MILDGTHISLRALEPEDLEFLYGIENDSQFWEVSHTQSPFSKFLLKQYLENSHQDIYESKQLRLMIIDKENGQSLGMIDLFDFNPQHQRTGIGIVIDTQFQGKGYASDALKTLIGYCFSTLNLHQLFANITPDNQRSIQLFEKAGFQLVGEKKDWLLVNGRYKNELIFQLIHE
jgi:diamine N-acetyltransferase